MQLLQSESVSIEFEILPDRLFVLDRSGSFKRQILPAQLSVEVLFAITVELLDNDTSLEDVSQAIQSLFDDSGEIIGFNSVGMLFSLFTP